MKPVHFVLAIVVGWPAVGGAQAVNPQAAAQAEFQKRLAAYVALKSDLNRRLGPLSTALSAAELATRQRQLATAIQEARKSSRPGDLFAPPIVQVITETIKTDLARRPLTDKRAAFEEVPTGTRPVLNRVYPVGAALATVPPLLLNNLPRLPDNLQYRFFDRHVVLLDGDTELIVDYILDVLPPLAQNDPDHRTR